MQAAALPMSRSVARAAARPAKKHAAIMDEAVTVGAMVATVIAAMAVDAEVVDARLTAAARARCTRQSAPSAARKQKFPSSRAAIARSTAAIATISSAARTKNLGANPRTPFPIWEGGFFCTCLKGKGCSYVSCQIRRATPSFQPVQPSLRSRLHPVRYMYPVRYSHRTFRSPARSQASGRACMVWSGMLR